MKRFCTIFVFCFLFSIVSQAQTTALECVNTEVICDFDDLDGFSFIMPVGNSPGSQPTPICPDGGAPHNMSWLSFIAHEGNYTIKLFGDSCTGSVTGVEGLQYGIYKDCTFTESVICNPNCSLDTLFISSDLLIPGDTYYMFVDGCSESVCDISIDIDGNYEGDYCDTISSTYETTSDSDQLKVSIYPNPAYGQIHLDSKFEFNEVLVYNARAQVIHRYNFTTYKNQLDIDIDGLERGIHFIEIRNGRMAYFSKFIVE